MSVNHERVGLMIGGSHDGYLLAETIIEVLSPAEHPTRVIAQDSLWGPPMCMPISRGKGDGKVSMKIWDGQKISPI